MDMLMQQNLKPFTDFLIALGIDRVSHTQKTYLGHLVNVYRLMESHGCTEELCRAGMFHSIYGTEKFQGFKLPVEKRGEVAALIGERAERLGYMNSAVDRASMDRELDKDGDSYCITDRITGEAVNLNRADFEDLCRVHLFDWLEQVPRSQYGWGYRRSPYRRMAERLGGEALTLYDDVFEKEPVEAK